MNNRNSATTWQSFVSAFLSQQIAQQPITEWWLAPIFHLTTRESFFLAIPISIAIFIPMHYGLLAATALIRSDPVPTFRSTFASFWLWRT